VPEITLLFWVIKLLTTAGGEATSDYLALGSHAVGAVVEVGLLLIGLVWQFSTRRYVAAAYWFLAYAIAIFGTGVSDTLHLTFGLPYAATTILWAVVLAAVFWTWHRSEGTLSIHSVTTRRRECFYWATVFAIALALGILAMSIGLIRSETASELRTLTATGASSRTRRGLTAATAGGLAFLGALLGTVAAYVGLVGWFHSNALEGGLSDIIDHIPWSNLFLIVIAMPIGAAIVGWTLAGRDPAELSTRPGE